MMNLEMLTAFFLWCTVINGGLLILWTVLLAVSPNLLYRTQRRWFSGSEETFNVVMYSFLGLFKIVFLVFNLVPYLALLIIG